MPLRLWRRCSHRIGTTPYLFLFGVIVPIWEQKECSWQELALKDKEEKEEFFRCPYLFPMLVFALPLLVPGNISLRCRVIGRELPDVMDSLSVGCCRFKIMPVLANAHDYGIRKPTLWDS